MSQYPEQEIPRVLERVQQIVGEKHATSSLLERINNAVGIHHMFLKKEELPYVVARPANAQEVSRLLVYANEERIPVFVRGSGTSLSGASDYRHKGIVLNTSRMNHVHIFRENGYAELGPGRRCEEAMTMFEDAGYFFPMHPGSVRIATVGGVACNNTSAHVVDPRMGKSKDYILGVEAVTPEGEILDVGTKSLRRPAGLDLTQLFVGGDGLFGVITNVRMRLHPLPSYAYGVAFFEDGRCAARSVQRMYQESLTPPLFLEYLDKHSADPGFEVQNLPTPPGPLILFQFAGYTVADAQAQCEELLSITRQEGAVNAFAVTDPDYWSRVWTARASSGPFAAQKAKGLIISAEVVSTVERLVEAYDDVVVLGKDMPKLSQLFPNYLYGHLGALSFHPSYVLPAAWPDKDRAEAVAEVFKLEAQLNTKYETCGGEWGQTGRRNAFYRQRYGEANFALIRRMKAAFDPNNILNPDVLPDL
jgi:glycolate oxidase